MNIAIDSTIFAKTSIDHGPRSLLGRVLLKAEARRARTRRHAFVRDHA